MKINKLECNPKEILLNYDENYLKEL